MTDYDKGLIEGQYVYQNDLMRRRVAALEAELEEARRTPRRRGKPAGVIEDGKYYPIPTSRLYQFLVVVGWCVAVGGGLWLVMQFLSPLAPPPTTTIQVLGTADVPPRPTQEPPRSAPASVPLFPDATPVPAYDNRAYNATAQARQAEPTPAPEEDRWADGEFWTEAEQAAFAATDVAAAKAKTDEFINNPPTPAPELIDEMEQKCGDAALVARSPLLQLWCAPLEGD